MPNIQVNIAILYEQADLSILIKNLTFHYLLPPTIHKSSHQPLFRSVGTPLHNRTKPDKLARHTVQYNSEEPNLGNRRRPLR